MREQELMGITTEKSLVCRTPESLLRQFNELGVVLIGVEVLSRKSLTGARKEKGEWISRFHNEMIEKHPQALGSRLLWNQILYGIADTQVEKIAQSIQRLLVAMTDRELISRCALVYAEGNITQKISILEGLIEELSPSVWEKEPNMRSLTDWAMNPNICYRWIDGNAELTPPD